MKVLNWILFLFILTVFYWIKLSTERIRKEHRMRVSLLFLQFMRQRKKWNWWILCNVSSLVTTRLVNIKAACISKFTGTYATRKDITQYNMQLNMCCVYRRAMRVHCTCCMYICIYKKAFFRLDQMSNYEFKTIKDFNWLKINIILQQPIVFYF